MTMQEWVNMLGAIADGKVVMIPYQLHRDGQINDIIHSLGGEHAAYNYFKKVLKAEFPKIIQEIE